MPSSSLGLAGLIAALANIGTTSGSCGSWAWLWPRGSSLGAVGVAALLASRRSQMRDLGTLARRVIVHTGRRAVRAALTRELRARASMPGLKTEDGIADIGSAWAAWIIDPGKNALGILPLKE